MNSLDLPIRAATETAHAHGIETDRCEVLQNAHTLVLRLSESLVARVVTDFAGPRQGSRWFDREIAVAQFLSSRGAPVIPVHSDLPPGPYMHLGYAINFWQFVTIVDDIAEPQRIGSTLFECHHQLCEFPQTLPKLAILNESLELLDTLERRRLFHKTTLALLQDRLSTSISELGRYPHQPLHGDAHGGNLLNTTHGLLWTDWEDTFSGPVEWDLASIIWNARLLEPDPEVADLILKSYVDSGGKYDQNALNRSLIARAAVMSAWYPILYPDPSIERQNKLNFRLKWLSENA